MSASDAPKHSNKRIIVCCDGTGLDGTVMASKSAYSNVLRLARAINSADKRDANRPPIPQIVFYQSGIGSENNFYAQYLKELDGKTLAQKARELWGETIGTADDATGGALAEKVQEAYSFISNNFEDQDEIFLIGFSRGAYTARMVADLIGQIGVLDRTGMDNFGEIFIAYQKAGDRNEISPEAFKSAEDTIHKYRKFRTSKDSFSVKCVAVFDTVGSVGLPETITHMIVSNKSIFGFKDNLLGLHVERALHALAIDEKRKDFLPVLFEKQVDKDTHQYKEGQLLKQCWFRGVHSDIGGSYLDHDLSDITLIWMAANLNDILSINLDYVKKIPNLVRPYGEYLPHNSLTGVYHNADTVDSRDLPPITNDITLETIHPSVLKQPLPTQLQKIYSENPAIITKTMPVEDDLWKEIPYTGTVKSQPQPDADMSWIQSAAEEAAKVTAQAIFQVMEKSSRGPKASNTSWDTVTSGLKGPLTFPILATTLIAVMLGYYVF